MGNEEIVYSSAKTSKRGLALLIDAFFTIFLSIILFALSNTFMTKAPFYLEVTNKREAIQKESGLYSDSFVLISEYVDSLNISSREKNEYMSTRIDSFYKNKSFFVDGADPYEGYNQRREKASSGSTSLFIYDDGKLKENSMADPIAILDFYKGEVNDECLKLFYQYPGYLDTNRFLFLFGIGEALVCLTISFSVFYLLLPLTIFKRGKKTLGMYIFKIALVGKDGLSLKATPYVGRFFFDYFIFVILGFASFLLTWAISFTILLLSKRKQSLDDYILNQYKVDASKQDVYLDYYEYVHSKQARKEASLENNDFNIESKKEK